MISLVPLSRRARLVKPPPSLPLLKIRGSDTRGGGTRERFTRDVSNGVSQTAIVDTRRAEPPREKNRGGGKGGGARRKRTNCRAKRRCATAPKAARARTIAASLIQLRRGRLIMSRAESRVISVGSRDKNSIRPAIYVSRYRVQAHFTAPVKQRSRRPILPASARSRVTRRVYLIDVR